MNVYSVIKSQCHVSLTDKTGKSGLDRSPSCINATPDILMERIVEWFWILLIPPYDGEDQ